jgi:hypothetical protein
MPPLEIVGADEIIGDDYLEDEVGDNLVGDDDEIEALLGGPQRRTAGRSRYARARVAAAVAKAAAGATVVRAERPTESRQLPIGFVSLAVAAGATVTVTTRPQILFRPTRLVIPSLTAPFFTIDDVKVGNKSQLIASGSIPAESFSQTAFNTPFKMDTCQISMDLIVETTNVDVAPHDFRATMFGDVVF